MRLLFTICLSFLFLNLVSAQVEIFPLKYNLKVATAAKQHPIEKATARSEKGADLPFFDDFSYNGPFPTNESWIDRNVFINNTLANKPVSIGVATFDGLDATGSPYGGSGSADTLTSITLDLSGSATKYISYYVQPKGLGDAPGIEDRLVLEFKNSAGEWIEIKSHEVTLEEAQFPIDSLPTFQFIEPIPIADPQFQHEDFQFRFRNFALRTGAADLWHLDYVRLENERPLQSTGDLAFTEAPGTILSDYSSAPWRHLKAELATNNQSILRTVDINLYNHFNNPISTDVSSLLINGIGAGEVLRFRQQTLLDQSNGLEQVNIVSGRNQFTNPIKGEYTSAYGTNFDDLDKVKVEVNYSFEQNNAEPERTKRNNSVSRIFDLDNYYAYDDGSAESALIVGTNGQIAVKFTNYKEDLLQAIRVQIPRLVNNVDQSTFTLKVWLNDLNSEPVFEMPFIKPLFIDEYRDSLQAFTTYVLKDVFTEELTPVELPVGDFYVGWEQTTPCANVNCVPFGLDRNSPDASETIFVNVDGDWGAISSFYGGETPNSVKGALMIRPVVGSEAPSDSEGVVSTTEIDLSQTMHIFPNPTTGNVNFQVFEGNYEDYEISIFNTLGQTIQQQTLSAQIDLSNQMSGIYFLQFVHTETRAIGNYKLLLNSK